MLNKCQEYFMTLKVENIEIFKHPRKTFALGFLTSINSIQILPKDLLNNLGFKYILTYKFSQDHLELLFSCIRSRGGHNNNPNVKQFQLALRKLMFRNSVQSSEKGNCWNFDSNVQNCVLSFAAAEASVTMNDDEDVDNVDLDSLSIYDVVDNSSNSYYKNNILYYICGYVVRKIVTKLKCEECIEMLSDSGAMLTPYTHFTDFVSRGKLVRSSSDVMTVVKTLNGLIKENGCKKKLDTIRMTTVACRILVGNVFKSHKSNVEFGEEIHEIKLIKMIGSLFYKIMCYNMAKESTTNALRSKIGVRQKLSKLVLFSNV